MKLYKPQDIFDLANQTYSMKLTQEKNQKEIRTIKKAITRTLENTNQKLPLTQKEAEFLVNTTMNQYFLKKAKEFNPSITQDEKKYNTLTKLRSPITTTYTQALIDLKLNFIISQLAIAQNRQITFNTQKFNQDFYELQTHIDQKGYPLPGYTEAKKKIEDINRYFITKDINEEA